MARLGFYAGRAEAACVVGYEVAGTIAALGGGVDGGLQVGQRVVAPGPVRRLRRARLGAGRWRASRCPDGMSFEQGAAVPIAYATAWEALIRAATCSRASGC